MCKQILSACFLKMTSPQSLEETSERVRFKEPTQYVLNQLELTK